MWLDSPGLGTPLDIHRSVLCKIALYQHVCLSSETIQQKGFQECKQMHTQWKSLQSDDQRKSRRGVLRRGFFSSMSLGLGISEFSAFWVLTHLSLWNLGISEFCGTSRMARSFSAHSRAISSIPKGNCLLYVISTVDHRPPRSRSTDSFNLYFWTDR